MTKEKPWTSTLQQKAPQLDSSIENYTGLKNFVLQPHMAAMTK